jgi:hypothetical protein
VIGSEAASSLERLPENFDAYIDLNAEEICRLVLCLMIEERLRSRLAVFRSQDLDAQPVEGLKEFAVRRHDVVRVSDAAR